MLSKVYSSCHFMWSCLICLCSDVLVLIVVHFVITWGLVFLRCLSVCYILYDYHWFWFSPVAIVGWCINVSNSWFGHFMMLCDLGADFITSTLLSNPSFSRVVTLVFLPLHDDCISCGLYSMYFLFLCSDLCPLLRYQQAGFDWWILGTW